ncbi:Transposase [Phytophthora cinnamomi]|uniref:Transposase n=1 Tax=Phytophthora cinnamomi TaxID=4785 RepID=UPI002A265480|nr:Transposase [Phytophthora cinnamomi]KAJ8557075.1 hypothetical protein ON010_g8888 [Phytophthora cinnamomi]
MVQGQPREVKLVKQKQIGVHEFWCGLQKFPQIRKVVLAVCSSSGSSAAAERNVSAHKFIYSSVLNRLDEANVEKLVLIFPKAKKMDQNEIADFDALEDLTDESCGEESGYQGNDFE